MRPRRVTLVLVSAFLILLTSVAALVLRQASGEDLEATLWVNAVLIVLGLLMLARASLGPAADIVPDRCARCGGRTFETTRSLDRHAVRTCFSCGVENDESPINANPGPVDVETPSYPGPAVQGEKN